MRQDGRMSTSTDADDAGDTAPPAAPNGSTPASPPASRSANSPTSQSCGRPPGVAHLRRLRQLWRSAGWPCHDLLELDLLAGGWLERRLDAQGRDTLRLTDEGIRLLHAGLQGNRALRHRHEHLVQHMAIALQRAGRLVWRGLSLRAGLPRDDDPARLRWVNAMPDLYSVRQTTVPGYLEPAVHEIKVSRADLLAELRRPAKAHAYLALSGQCWYVLRAGIATTEEIPSEFGVLLAHETATDTGWRFELARPAPRRPLMPDFATWMALAKATPEPAPIDEGQSWLGEHVDATGAAAMAERLITEDGATDDGAGAPPAGTPGPVSPSS